MYFPWVPGGLSSANTTMMYIPISIYNYCDIHCIPIISWQSDLKFAEISMVPRWAYVISTSDVGGC